MTPCGLRALCHARHTVRQRFFVFAFVQAHSRRQSIEKVMNILVSYFAQIEMTQCWIDAKFEDMLVSSQR
jgi:hypothetical protein